MNGLFFSMPLFMQSVCQTGEAQSPLKESPAVNFPRMQGGDCGAGATQGGTEADKGVAPAPHLLSVTACQRGTA
jgi:hypothetical protein